MVLMPLFTESVNHAKVVPTSMLKHRISDIRLLNNAFAFLFILSLSFRALPGNSSGQRKARQWLIILPGGKM
jgi:hypothetical protein